MTKNILILIPFLFLFNCKKREKRIVNTAFHHWKSHLELNDFERNYCKELNAKTLYLRFFDIDFNAQNKFPEPIAELNFNANNLINFDKIIPTIFITNRTLINIDDNKIDSLSLLIVNKLKRFNVEEVSNLPDVSEPKNKIQELLIDCDWTEKTRDKFFHLIKQLKTITNKKIITTIRLHQIKFKEKTGIPPADKGLLMAYNTSDLSDPQTINSILDITVLKSYIANLNNYPLDLDIALPIFSWGIVKRDGQTVQLINNFSKDFLLKNKSKNSENTEGSYFENKTENKIEILKNGYYNGIYLYADDVIKIEEVSVKDLDNAASLLSQHIHNQEVTVSFFSLDSVNLKRYNSNDLLKIANGFK
jgi:hypothetical protein